MSSMRVMVFLDGHELGVGWKKNGRVQPRLVSPEARRQRQVASLVVHSSHAVRAGAIAVAGEDMHVVCDAMREEVIFVTNAHTHTHTHTQPI